MAGVPSITVYTSDLPTSSSNERGPWNSYDASTNRAQGPPPTVPSSPNNLRPRQSEEEEGTSQVDDYGDTKYLDQPNRSARRQSISPTGDDAFVQVGSRFPETPDSSGLEPWDTRSTGGESISLRSNGELSTTLSGLVREKRKFAVGVESRIYYPISDLEAVVTRTAARQELGNLPDVEAILDYIFVPRTISDHKTRAFKIFVILALMGKPEAIRDFIDDEIYDLDLPFDRVTAEGALRNRDQYIRNPNIPGRTHSEIGFFKQWDANDIDSFMEKQHAVCVPIFDFDTQPGAPVSHYNLHAKTVLPFVENEESGLRSEGLADVWRVKIHPAHTICQALGPNMSLAVKQLRHRVGKPLKEECEKFIKEARNLRRFATRDHDFIIKLLCTFQWRGHYYFLFPWADGNLYDFWRRHPTPLAPLRQPSTARWFSTQCLGLVTALRDIHLGDAHSTLHLNPLQKNHGKHGDIKPENILYFKSCSEEDAVTHQACRAHLKISDLGEAEFHSTISMEVDARGVLHTPSYSAPELRIKKTSMPKYDMFSLACVLLEFVKWYLHGFQAVNEFSKRRLKEQEAPVYSFHAGDYNVDSFFKHVDLLWLDGRRIGAMHKSSVNQEIQQLLEDQNCSEYIMDLLVFIREQLLRINPKNRADCDTIYKKFQDLDKRCREDDMYCVKKLNQPPTRVRTDRSLLFDADIKLPDGQEFEVVALSKSGQSGQYEVKVVNKTSHAPPTGGSSVSATAASTIPPANPHPRLQPELSLIEEVQIEQNVDRQQNSATVQTNTSEVRDTIEDISTSRDIESLIDSDIAPKPSDNTRFISWLHIPGISSRVSLSDGSIHRGQIINSPEHGGRSSVGSQTRLVRRTPSDKDRSDRGDLGERGHHGVEVKVKNLLRRAFCCFL